MINTYIVGIGMTRFGKHRHESVKSLTAAAVTQALADCSIPPERVGAAFFANTVQGELEGQLMIRGQIALRPLGFEGIPIINVENACASGATAVNLAVNHIRSGSADLALAVGVDKMISPDRELMFGIFDGAWDVHDAEAGRARLLSLGSAIKPPVGVSEQKDRSFFMDVYAAFAKAHIAAFGTTQRQIAKASAKNHCHSALNPNAQYQHPLTVDEVLKAQEIIWPFTSPMCAPVSDGAAAVLICSEDVLKELPNPRPVKILASQIKTGVDRTPMEFEKNVSHLVAQAAYNEAGVGPEDISCAEIHDATAFAEIQQVESLMFTSFGRGGELIESGACGIGGRIPVNTSGGLQSRGHPIGATGIAQLHELALQLRAEARDRQVEGARLAIAENGGGLYGIEEASVAVTILEANK